MFTSREYRFPTPSEDAEVKIDHLLSKDLTVNSFMKDETFAQAEQQRLLSLFSPGRHLYRISVSMTGILVGFGSQVTIIFPRYGLNGGKQGTIVGQRFDAAPRRVRAYGVRMILLWHNLVDQAVSLTPSNQLSTLPVSNIQNPHISKPWGTQTTQTLWRVIVDLGFTGTCGVLGCSRHQHDAWYHYGIGRIQQRSGGINRSCFGHRQHLRWNDSWIRLYLLSLYRYLG